MAKKFVDDAAVAELVSKTKQLVATKQDTLVSGTNLKTINNTSLLGSGNISVSALDGYKGSLSKASYTNQEIYNLADGIYTFDPTITYTALGDYTDMVGNNTKGALILVSSLSGGGATIKYVRIFYPYSTQSDILSVVSGSYTMSVYNVEQDLITKFNGKQNVLPTSTTAGQVLKSTSTAGTVEWGSVTGGGDVTEITTQYVGFGNGTSSSTRTYITAAGIYKLTYNGTKYINYYGTNTSTSYRHTVVGGSGTVYLFVNRYSTTSFEWYYVNGSSIPSICSGYTTVTSGGVSTVPLSDILVWDDILDTFYPVGSIYLTTDTDDSPASFIGGEWEQLPDGFALWTASSGTYADGGTSGIISAGLPNITGGFSASSYQNSTSNPSNIYGAFATTSATIDCPKGSNNGGKQFTFSASSSNSIYGNSTTVQPPAIKICAWVRVA